MWVARENAADPERAPPPAALLVKPAPGLSFIRGWRVAPTEVDRVLSFEEVERRVKTLPELIDLTRKIAEKSSSPRSRFNISNLQTVLQNLEFSLASCDFWMLNYDIYYIGKYYGQWEEAELSSKNRNLTQRDMRELQEKIETLLLEVNVYLRDVCGFRIPPSSTRRPRA